MYATVSLPFCPIVCLSVSLSISYSLGNKIFKLWNAICNCEQWTSLNQDRWCVLHLEKAQSVTAWRFGILNDLKIVIWSENGNDAVIIEVMKLVGKYLNNGHMAHEDGRVGRNSEGPSGRNIWLIFKSFQFTAPVVNLCQLEALLLVICQSNPIPGTSGSKWLGKYYKRED